MLIASGRYVHFEDDVPNGVTETWHRYRQPDQSDLLKIEYQSKQTLLADVVIFDGRICQFNYYAGEHVRGIYRLPEPASSHLHVTRWLGNTRLEDVIPWSQATVLDLPFLCCKGHTILKLHRHGIAPVFAPLLRAGDRAGDLKKLNVQQTEHDTVSVEDMVYSTTRYAYTQDYWLDEDGTVVQAQHESYRMLLVEYNH